MYTCHLGRLGTGNALIINSYLWTVVVEVNHAYLNGVFEEVNAKNEERQHKLSTWYQVKNVQSSAILFTLHYPWNENMSKQKLLYMQSSKKVCNDYFSFKVFAVFENQGIDIMWHTCIIKSVWEEINKKELI